MNDEEECARCAALEEAAKKVDQVADGWEHLATPRGEKGVYQTAAWTCSATIRRLKCCTTVTACPDHLDVRVRVAVPE